MMTESEGQRWTERAVSWGQLLISMGALGLVVIGVVVTNEQRITRLEVRQQQVMDENKMQDERYYRTVTGRNQEYAQLRNEINQKLDRIESEMTALKVAISSMRARQ